MSTLPAVSSDKPFSLRTRKPIDDSTLLTEEDRAEKEKSTGDAGDCSKRPRACKNCVCGRAELEAKAAAEGGTADVSGIAPPPGGCGNCSRGDAFRCAGCPFRGKPAFNTTQDGTVQLSLTDDA